MLEKILRVDGVGIFHNGVPSARALAKLTLIYADNARGKSTLSAILRACAAGDAQALTSRATIGGTRAAAVHLRFKDGACSRTVKFEGGGWDSEAPPLYVFDNAFVEQNVYAASEVSTGHHEALLDFALGSAAVAKRREVEKHGDAQTAATRARTDADNKLLGHRGATPLSAFLKLDKDDEANAKIAELERRIANAREVAALNARASLRTATLPSISWDGFEPVLQATFKQMQEGASALVDEHLRKHYWRGINRWVAEGRTANRHGVSDECPFCGQAMQGLVLVKAYETYFTSAYNEHMEQVGGLRELANNVLPQASIDSWASQVGANKDRANGWKPQLELSAASLDFQNLRQLAATVREAFQRAAEQKTGAPLDAVDLAVLEPARFAAQELDALLNAYNESVEDANSDIEKFRKGLATENILALQQQIAALNLQKVRYTAPVVALIAERAKADGERSACEKAKEEEQKELNRFMEALLAKYQAAINRWLDIFGAPFSIEDMGYTYQGKTTPRTEYAIVLRNTKVPAGRKSADRLAFQSALSEGDKRTLALAVFLARIQDDANAGAAIVVLDDIFASLDYHRRVTTMSAIGTLVQLCAQLIVLAHDPFFLRDLGRGLKRKKLADPLTLQSMRSMNHVLEPQAVS